MRLIPVLTAGLVLSLLAACSVFEVIDRLVPETGYRLEAGIPYGAGTRQKLDVYRPAVRVKSKAVIVFLYGGRWRKGERRNYRFVGQMLASRGYLVVIPDYRLYPEVTFPGFVEDAAAAIAWVYREIATRGGDPGRIVVAGHSAGAHSAALVALDRTYLKRAGVPHSALAGWIGLAGPYAFDPLKFSNTRPIFATARPPASARPITFVHAGAPPALLIHGDQDWTVSDKNSVELARLLRKAGGKVRYVSVADTGHGGLLLGLAEPFGSGSQVVRQIIDFVESLAGRAVSRVE
jgi:acetyl esterase/lipase